jgi:hypothetical protein
MVKDSFIESAPIVVVRRSRLSLSDRSIFLLVACACMLLLGLNVFRREFYTGDEGFYSVMARNMLLSPAYWLRPTYFPQGDFLADHGAIAHPPFNSYFYALTLWLSRGSLAALEMLSALSFAVLLYFVYRLLKLFDVQAGRFAVLLLAVSPAIPFYYFQLEAEPLLTTFGFMALYCGLRAGFAVEQRPLLFVSGLCLGVSFALKLWLCGPLALALAVGLLLRAREPGIALRDKLLGVLIFGLGGVIPAGLHLAAIACFYPQDLSFWLRDIYFGIFTGVGVSGGKASGEGLYSGWLHPFWYYGAVLYRDYFFLFPIIAFGFISAVREDRSKAELRWIVLAGLAGLAPLSVMKVKEPLYVLTCMIFLFLLAGICLAALVRRSASNSKTDSLSRRVGLVVTLGLLALVPVAYVLGFQPGKVTRGFVVAHSIILVVLLALFQWGRRKGDFVLEWSVYGACAIALAAQFGHRLMTQHPRDQIISGLIRPYVESNAPNTLSMVASDFKSYQLYCFRRGCYWEETPLMKDPEAVLAMPQYSHVRAFILDPEDKKYLKMDLTPWLNWLAAHATDKTGELDAKLGSVSGFRVFVR